MVRSPQPLCLLWRQGCYNRTRTIIVSVVLFSANVFLYNTHFNYNIQPNLSDTQTRICFVISIVQISIFTYIFVRLHTQKNDMYTATDQTTVLVVKSARQLLIQSLYCLDRLLGENNTDIQTYMSLHYVYTQKKHDFFFKKKMHVGTFNKGETHQQP